MDIYKRNAVLTFVFGTAILCFTYNLFNFPFLF